MSDAELANYLAGTVLAALGGWSWWSWWYRRRHRQTPQKDRPETHR